MKNKNYKESLSDKLVYALADSHPIFVFLVATLMGVLFLFAVASPFVALNYVYGVNGFGPEEEQVITVERLYVDGGKSSHYMVGTDKGVFEVSNFIFPVQIYNSDEIYSQLAVGKTYHIKTKGNKILNWWYQEYPYIMELKEIKK